MPIDGLDPTIPLGGRTTQANPLGMISQFAALQNALNQNRLFQQTFAARQRAGQLLAGADPNDPEAGIRALMSDPLTAPFAPEIISSMRQGELTLLQMQGEQYKQAQTGLEGVFRALPTVMADPSQWGPVMNAQLSVMSPVARQRVAPAIDSLRTALTEGLPSDPTQARAVFNQRLNGMLVSGGFGSDAINAVTGRPTNVNLGGQTVFGTQAPAVAGGAFTPASALPMSLAPTLTTGPYGAGGAQTPVVIGGGGTTATPGGLAARPAPGGGPALAAPAGAGGTPAAGGVSGPSLVMQKYLTDRGTDMAAYQQELDSNVRVGSLIMQTLTEGRDAQKLFTSGGGASAYARLAQFAQAFGAPQDLVDKIGNGNLGASQEFNKLMVNTTMGQIREQLQGVGASRLSQMEFQTFQRNNPNIDTDPRAIEKIFNFWTKLYQRDHAEQTELNKYIKGGGDISEWPATWQDIAQKRGFITPEITNTTGAPGASRRWDPTSGKLVPMQ